MSELVDETEALQANVEGLRNLSNSLKTFNESFASWLYVMNMNALTTDWPQAPTDASFQLADRRAEEDARAALDAIQNPPVPNIDLDKTTITETTEEMTYAANTTIVSTTSGTSGKSVKMVKKKGNKPKLTAKEKKERNILVEKTISCLPLEFRGSDPNLRRNMETVMRR
jgi:DASH complex subunit DAM1